MAEYVAFDTDVEVKGAAVLAVIRGMGLFEKQARKVLSHHGISDPQRDIWYPQQAWLDAFREINQQLGPKALFEIGKAIPQTASWPNDDVDGIVDALRTINVAYQMNHRGGYIGSYDYYPIAENTCRMICQNPYPDEFDRGIITEVVTRHKPAGTFMVEVSIDATLPKRSEGGDLCSFIITW